MKTWKELREEILRLGGVGQDRFDADPLVFVQALNRACAIVCHALAEPTPAPLSVAVADDQPLSLSAAAAVAVPLLAAFYVFEDEDERKAVRWREDAYDLLGRFGERRRGRAAVLSDGGVG